MRTISKKRYLSAALEAEAKNAFIADKIKADKDQKEDAKKEGKVTKDDKDGNGKPDKPGVDKDGKFVKAGAKADTTDDKKGAKVAKEDLRTPAERAAAPADGRTPAAPAARAPAGRAPEAAPAEGEVPPVEGDELPPVEPPAEGETPPVDGETPPEDGAEPPLEVDPEADVVPPADGEVPPAEGEPEPELDPEADPAPADDEVPAPAEGDAVPEGDAPPADGEAPADAPVDDVPPEADAIPPAADGEETPVETPPADGLGEDDPIDAAAAGSPTEDVPASDDNPLADVPPAEGEPPTAVDGLPPTDLADGEAPAEGADGERAPVEGEPAIAPDGEVNDVEGELLEASDVETEVQDNQRRIDDGLDAVRALESLYVSMEEGRQQGGVDKVGGQIAMCQVQYFSDRLGIPIANKFPALEDFNNYKSRLRANNVSLEGLREFIEKIWTGIRDAVLKSVAWFKSWYAKMFDAAKGLMARAKKMVSGGSEDVPGGPKSFQDESLAGHLYIDHAVPHGAAGALILKDVVDGVMGNIEEHASACEALASVFTKIAPGTSLAATAVTLEAALKEFNGKMMGLDLVNNPAADGFEALPQGMQLWRSKELPGGKAVLFRGITAATSETIGKLGGAMGDFKENRSEFIGKDVPYLTKDERAKMSTTVFELSLVISKSGAAVARAEKSKETIAAAAAKIAKMEFDESSKAAMARFQETASGITKFMDQPYAGFCAYALQTARHLMAQVERTPAAAEKPVA